MLTRLATFAVRWPKVILVVTLVLFGVGLFFGSTVSQKLGVGGFVDPASESTQVADYLDKNFGTTSNLVLELTARDGDLMSPGVVAAAETVRKVVEAEPSAKVIASFEQPSADDLRSKDGRSGLILVHVGGDSDEAAKTAITIIENLPTADVAATVRAGGTLGIEREIEDRVNSDLVVSESIALPISLIVLVIVFGGLVAAVLPLVVGVTSIVTTLLVLALLASVTDVSVHALTVATAFGLGLSIDFGLLMVSRFREERDKGRDLHDAILATVTTAGRTIIFSAATVTLAMSCLLVFPTYFLRSIALTAGAVVILSSLSAVVLLPALLTLLGTRIDALAVVHRKVPLSADSAFWRKCAELVTRRPLISALPVVAALLALGVPFLNVQLATPDERALPSDSNARLVAESLRTEYAVDTSQAITLLARDDALALGNLAAAVSMVDEVVRVDGPVGRFERGNQISGPVIANGQGGAYAFVYLSVGAESDAAQKLVRDIRARVATDQKVQVGGPTATLVDTRAAISDRLPLAIALIALTTFVLLFLFTGSVVVPIKALLLNLLVLSAVLGTMVWIFQDGHFASVLGITPAPLNLSIVVLLCCIAFSLSVDYEIFLLSRIKEARDSGLSNTEAIVTGLGRVGRIVTSAAVLLTITLLSFVNGLAFMKMFGIGTALAVVIDATLIRGVVVPAFLRVAGELNWWAPKPLKWLHARIGLSESPALESSSSEEVPNVRDEPDTTPIARSILRRAPALEVEVIPGRHLVANLNGTVVVVAHREAAAPTPRSAAARRMAELVQIVRLPAGQRFAALSRLTRGADFGIVMPGASGLDVYVIGGVTVALDNGVEQSLLRGAPAPRVLYRSLPMPDAAAVVTVDDVSGWPPARMRPTEVYSLAAGTVPGQGAIVCPVGRPTVVRDATDPARRPVKSVVLDDGSRFELDRECVLGRDPEHSDAARRGLRPIRVKSGTGRMSRAHLEIRRVDGGDVLVVDRGSTNGVRLREATSQGWTQIVPWEPAVWRPGASLQVGDRILQLHVPPAPGQPSGTPALRSAESMACRRTPAARVSDGPTVRLARPVAKNVVPSKVDTGGIPTTPLARRPY